jgi:glycosyltransferase involved in cell wall biosynthesis
MKASRLESGASLHACSVPLVVPEARQPLVSVVVPVFNGGAHLEETLATVAEQTYGNWELIVCDNSSTDETASIAADVAARDRRVRLVRFSEHLPARANFNRALREAAPAARYAKLLMADDLLMPDCLMRCVALWEAAPTAALVSAYRFDGDRLDGIGLGPGEVVAPGRSIVRRHLLGELSLLGSPSTVLMRTDLLRGPRDVYSLPFFHNYDRDAGLTLLCKGDLGFVHEPLTVSRVHPAQRTSRVNRVRAWIPADLAMVARHGPAVLEGGELRRRVVRLAGQYSSLILKQHLKGRARRDAEFRAYHREALGLLTRWLEEAGERAAAAALRVVRRTLGCEPPASEPA